jgi:hypothetical protein
MRSCDALLPRLDVAKRVLMCVRACWCILAALQSASVLNTSTRHILTATTHDARTPQRAHAVRRAPPPYSPSLLAPRPPGRRYRSNIPIAKEGYIESAKKAVNASTMLRCVPPPAPLRRSLLHARAAPSAPLPPFYTRFPAKSGKHPLTRQELTGVCAAAKSATCPRNASTCA